MAQNIRFPTFQDLLCSLCYDPKNVANRCVSINLGFYLKYIRIWAELGPQTFLRRVETSFDLS